MYNLKYRWDALGSESWEQLFAQVRRSSILQSTDYAKATSELFSLKARAGIIEINDKPAGLFITQEAGIWGNRLHAIIVDRGPLWLYDEGTPDQIEEFWRQFNAEFPRRFGRRRRIIPECPQTPDLLSRLGKTGLKRHNNPGYETIWLDLKPDLVTLRSGLKKNWRAALSKAGGFGIVVDWDKKGQTLRWFLQRYDADKKERGYNGPSVRLLHALGQSFGASGNMLIGRALLDGEPIAAILILCHGRSATYQAGWITDAGRQANAHHYLLWDALRILKERQVYDLDLGGVNDETAKGVKTFKEGMGGELVRLAGQYA